MITCGQHCHHAGSTTWHVGCIPILLAMECEDDTEASVSLDDCIVGQSNT